MPLCTIQQLLVALCSGYEHQAVLLGPASRERWRPRLRCMTGSRAGRTCHTGRPDSQGSFLFPFRRYYFHRLRREGPYAACTQPRIDAVCWVPPHIISRYIQTLTVHGRHDIHIKTRHISPAPWRSACCGLPHMTHHIRSLIRGPLWRPAATGSRVVLRSPTPAGSPARRRASRPRDVFGSYSTAA
jgi:hypothetical protein